MSANRLTAKEIKLTICLDSRDNHLFKHFSSYQSREKRGRPGIDVLMHDERFGLRSWSLSASGGVVETGDVEVEVEDGCAVAGCSRSCGVRIYHSVTGCYRDYFAQY
jgi:hypothetical protein